MQFCKKIILANYGTILVVDDNTSVFTTLEICLDGVFERVLTLTDPKNILLTLEQEEVDVILLDMNSAFVLIHKVGWRQAIFCTEAVAEIVRCAEASQIGCLSDIMLAIEQKFAGKSQTAVADIFVGRKRSQSLDLAIER